MTYNVFGGTLSLTQSIMWQIDPEKSLSLLDQPTEIRKKCEAEAEVMVKKTNTGQVRYFSLIK